MATSVATSNWAFDFLPAGTRLVPRIALDIGLDVDLARIDRELDAHIR